MDLGLIIAIDNDILLYEPSLFQPFFKAGDNVDEDDNFGHQMIARQAYKHVQSEYPHIFDSLLGNFDSDGKFLNNHIQNTNYVTRYANYPDIKGEFLNPFNDGNGFNYDHFYNSDNGGNYFNMSIPSTVIDSNNAKTRFIQHYNEAVSLWKSGNKVESYKSLGQALHFATDLSTPHHVGDQLPPWVTGPFAAAIAGAFLPPPGNTAYLAAAGVLTTYVADMIIGHALFESTVDDNITDIFNDSDNKNPDGSWIISKDYSNLTLDEIVEDTVALASDQYPFMNMFSNHTNIAYAIVPNAVDVSIGILKKFAEEVQFNTANLSNNEIRIDKVNWTIQGAYTLPSTLKGRTVTQIGDSAF